MLNILIHFTGNKREQKFHHSIGILQPQTLYIFGASIIYVYFKVELAVHSIQFDPTVLISLLHSNSPLERIHSFYESDCMREKHFQTSFTVSKRIVLQFLLGCNRFQVDHFPIKVCPRVTKIALHHCPVS